MTAPRETRLERARRLGRTSRDLDEAARDARKLGDEKAARRLEDEAGAAWDARMVERDVL